MIKKVLLLPAWYPSRHSAVSGIFIHELAMVLASKYNVAVLKPRILSWREIFGEKVLPKSSIETLDGIQVIREEFFIPPKMPLKIWSKLYMGVTHRGYKKILSLMGKPDIIHAHVLYPTGWAAAMLSDRYKIPVVTTEHSVSFEKIIKIPRKQQVMREAITNTHCIIAVSPAHAEQIRPLQPNLSIEVIGNVINTDFFVPGYKLPNKKDPSNFQFFSCALLLERKGYQFMIEAVHLLVGKGFKNFEVLIGGDGPFRPKLEAMVLEAGLDDKIVFLGELDREMVRERMQQCDVFVHPSLDESFGVVLGEAMACGKPVIATRCGGPEYVVTPETGLLVDVANAGELAGAMESFLLRQVNFCSEEIRRSVHSRFGPQAILEKLSMVYEQALG
jgi:L-malate glycosyltransferase